MGRGGVGAHLSRVEVLRSRGRCSGRGDQGRDFGIPALVAPTHQLARLG